MPAGNKYELCPLPLICLLTRSFCVYGKCSPVQGRVSVGVHQLYLLGLGTWELAARMKASKAADETLICTSYRTLPATP